MVMTKDFAQKKASDNACRIFKLATALGCTVRCSDNDDGTLRNGFMLVGPHGAELCYPGIEAFDDLIEKLEFACALNHPSQKA